MKDGGQMGRKEEETGSKWRRGMGKEKAGMEERVGCVEGARKARLPPPLLLLPPGSS